MKAKEKICKNCYHASKCNKVTTGLVCGVKTINGFCDKCGQPIKNMRVFIPVDKKYTCNEFTE